MVRNSLLGVVVFVAAEAWQLAALGEPLFDEAELVSGNAFTFTEPAALIRMPSRQEVFALDAEMRAFVAPFKELRDARRKLDALIKGLAERGLSSLEYAEITRTVGATFHDRQGNCLSFTMLFVALAREIGLPVSYRTVDVQPSWSNDGRVVIASHVNAVVRTGMGEETTVDFNVRDARSDPRARRVDDNYALGLFYTNLGAEALVRGELAASLAYLREAATVHADIAGLWVNLGVLYGRQGHYAQAEAAYLRALEIDDGELSALANLVIVYKELGDAERAAFYRQRVQGYRERNPYYHYASAASAYEERQFDAALVSLRKALRLKVDEHEFHALRGEVLTMLGREREARHSFERAREYAASEYARTQALVRFEGFDAR